MSAFDSFVNEQRKSPSFEYHYRHEGAKIAAVDRLMNDGNLGRPVPKFQIAYYIEEKLPQNKVKQTHYRGQPVGLINNYNCGTIHDAVWSIEDNQWIYSIYPWTGDRKNKRATEEVILPIKEWMNNKLIDDELVIDDEFINSFSFFGVHRCLEMNIKSHYNSLMSGRVRNMQMAIDNLKRLVRKYIQLELRVNS